MPPNSPIVRAAVPLPPVTMARPRFLVLTSAAVLPPITLCWKRRTSAGVRSLTVRLPRSGMM